MSRMPKSSKGRRPRRQFSDEFRMGAVRLVLAEGKTVGAVAREGKTGLTTEERAELARLRKEVRELRMERDILKNGHGPRPTRAGMKVVGCAARCGRAKVDAYWCH